MKISCINARPSLRAKHSMGFTLVELLVVISIIALLVGILLPVLGSARNAAKGAISLSNLRQIGIANGSYLINNKDYYPAHEAWFVPSLGTLVASTTDPDRRRSHWEDHMIEYMPSPKAFLSPLLTNSELVNGFTNPYAIDPYNANGDVRGGYGYNMHYLGAANKFNAKDGINVKSPTQTVLVGDAAGTRKGVVDGPHTNSYAIEPPKPSLNFGAQRDKYYGDAKGSTRSGGVETPPTTGDYDWLYRAYPAPRNNGVPGFVFCDGHAAYVELAVIDDFNGDGVLDNGYWNGLADADPSDSHR